MTFVQIEKRNGMINLDGYSKNKTLWGALSDLAREVAKINKAECDCILNNFKETVEMVESGMQNVPDAYYIEAFEVPCASQYKYNDDDENNFEIEYAEGRWYLYIRFVDAA